LEGNTSQSNLLLNSKINIDINESEIHATQTNKIERNKQKKPKIIKNEICKVKVNILQNNLDLSNDDLPKTSLLERSDCFSIIDSNSPFRKESILSSSLSATKSSEASVINDISVIAGKNNKVYL